MEILDGHMHILDKSTTNREQFRYNLIYDVSDKSWLRFWYVYIAITFVSVVIFTIWYGIGGILNIRDLFKRLSVIKRDVHDDGMVIENHNLSE